MTHPTTTEESKVDEEPKAVSLFDRIRAQQKHVASDQTVELPIPGYSNPALVVKYRWVDPDEVKEIGVKVRAQFATDEDRMLYAAMDVMIVGCEGLYMRDTGEKTLQPLDPGDGILRFDDRLERFFEREPSGSARTAVDVAFKENPYAVVAHGQLLQRWMADTTIDLSRLLGEA